MEIKDRPVADNDYAGGEVRLCKDGKYRWKYELNMLKNPIIAITVFKVFFYIILAGFLIFGTFLYAIHGNWAGLLEMALVTLQVLILFVGLTILGMLIVVIYFKAKYIVLFEMDENEIKHEVEPMQFKKAQKFAAVTAVAGAAGGSLTAAGAGMLAASHNASTSPFAYVRRIRPIRWLNTIKVNQLLNHNQIYVPKEDFDFVYEFIKSHCPKVK